MFRPRADLLTSRVSQPTPQGMFSIAVDVKLVGPLWTPRIFNGIFDRAREETLQYGKNLIEDKTPVDTGNLRSQWYTTNTDIINDEYYAAFVEYGTIFFDGYFMATDSIKAIETAYLANIQKEINKTISGKLRSLL